MPHDFSDFRNVNLDTLNAGTLHAIIKELAKARRKYPTNANILRSLDEMLRRTTSALVNHSGGTSGATAADVYEKAVIVAVLAIRLIEEGDANYKYRSGEATGQASLFQSGNRYCADGRVCKGDGVCIGAGYCP